MEPRWAKMVPARMEPRCAKVVQNGAEISQDVEKMAPRWLKIGSSWAKMEQPT